ncbi:MAG: flagellar basal body L-ring protein FlgH [Pseudomonadota bacterium]
MAVALALAGCAERLDHLGRPPTLTKPGQPEAMAVAPPAAARLSLAVPPNLPRAPTTPASLWHAGPRSLFGDRRARVRGDILTVVIDIDEEAAISNETGRSRTGSDEIAIQALLGLPSVADVILPGAGTLEPALSTRSSTATEGEGSVSREEEITLRLAATVERVLPNGHLVIRGSQEIRINFELRDLQISGIVRPEDISRANEIRLDKIADARIVYGGRGQITDVQQPRYGQQVVDMVSPF